MISIGTLIQYRWLGVSTPVFLNYPMGGQTQWSLGTSANHYAGLDQFGRPVDIQWLKGSTKLVHSQYAYDRSSNRQWRRDAAAQRAPEDVGEGHSMAVVVPGHDQRESHRRDREQVTNRNPR